MLMFYNLVSSLDGLQRLHLYGISVSPIGTGLYVLGIEQFHQLLAHKVWLVMAVVAFKIFHCKGDVCFVWMDDETGYHYHT